MLDAIDLHENFINVESVTESVTFLLEALGELRTELVAPKSGPASQAHLNQPMAPMAPPPMLDWVTLAIYSA